MRYTWTRNDFPPTIYDGKDENGKGIGSITAGVVYNDGDMGFVYNTMIGDFGSLEEAQAELIKSHEKHVAERER